MPLSLEIILKLLLFNLTILWAKLLEEGQSWHQLGIRLVLKFLLYEMLATFLKDVLADWDWNHVAAVGPLTGWFLIYEWNMLGGDGGGVGVEAFILYLALLVIMTSSVKQRDSGLLVLHSLSKGHILIVGLQCWKVVWVCLVWVHCWLIWSKKLWFVSKRLVLKIIYPHICVSLRPPCNSVILSTLVGHFNDSIIINFVWLLRETIVKSIHPLEVWLYLIVRALSCMVTNGVSIRSHNGCSLVLFSQLLAKCSGCILYSRADSFRHLVLWICAIVPIMNTLPWKDVVTH